MFGYEDELQSLINKKDEQIRTLMSLLDRLAENHNFHPLATECVCDDHTEAKEYLAKLRGEV